MAKEKRFKDLTDDEVFARWRERLEKVHNELMYLATTRRRFKDVEELFADNKRLHAIGSQPYRWIQGMWGRDAVIAVRRELDDDANTICFGTLLDEMASRPKVLTRARYMNFMKERRLHSRSQR